MSKPESLFIGRTWLPLEHREFLASHKDKINYDFPGISLGWRKLGRAGVILVQSGEYYEASRLPASRLSRIGASAMVKKINTRISAANSEGHRQTTEILRTDIVGDRPIVDIAFLVRPTPFASERNRLTNLIDGEAEVGAYWPRTDFFVSVATVPRKLASEELLQAFEEAQPATLTLLNARAQPA